MMRWHRDGGENLVLSTERSFSNRCNNVFFCGVVHQMCNFFPSSWYALFSERKGQRFYCVSLMGPLTVVGWLAVLSFFCSQILFSRSGLAEQTAVASVSELLRQQIEAWEIPSPPPETATVPQDTNVSPVTPEAASPTDIPATPPAPDSSSSPGTQPTTLHKVPPAKLMVGKDVLRS